MGLDLVVEGCPKPGHEAEWRTLLARSFAGDDAEDGEVERFQEISIPPFANVGAPRVGFDEAADAWLIKAGKAEGDEQVARMLQEMHGYYVLRLVESDGIPKYSHGGLYEGVDETSFRGAFLADCTDVLSAQLIEQAWGHKFPDAAISYGKSLLDAADDAEARRVSTAELQGKLGLFAKLGLTKPKPQSASFDEQLDIVRTAGKWFLFWGERGHAIRAWF